MALPIDNTYLNQRLEDLGITPHINQHFIPSLSPGDGQGEAKPKGEVHPFFEADTEGNIIINYFNLHGQHYSWKKEEAKWPIYYQRIRLRKEGIYRGQQKKDSAGKPSKAKYHQEKGSGQNPFFTPAILAKYASCKEAVNIDGSDISPIDTLFIVEGEFKAFKGYMAGLDIVGIPSIHGFYNGDVKGKLHEDIQELIVTCGVTKIVFLVDADLLTLRWEEKKDLSFRPESFFSAVKLFRESLQLLLDDENIKLHDVYVMHLATKFTNEAKGLDDLLSKYPAVQDEIKHDLFQFQFSKKYFAGSIITDSTKGLSNFRKYLGLFDEQEFYKCYGEFIGGREFLFRKRRFEYDAENKKVVFVRHEDADKYMRIGPDWIKVVKRVNPYGQIEEVRKKWSVGEIERDYKMGKNADYFISQLLRYDDFCNEPNWNGSYQRVHHGCYNLVTPLKWEYAQGAFPVTYKFLKHIFQGNASVQLDSEGKLVQELPFLGDQFTVILDWLSILLRHPKQMLPVPILVSKENGTGKSTFLKWLNMIFGSNMCILGNDQFKMKFNGHYITKFIIGIDEGFLDVDKKAEKERLKQLVTANRAFLEDKGMNVTEIAFYAKLIICSNDADRVMRIDEGESRWFVVKVPVIPHKEIPGQQLIEGGELMIEGKPVDAAATYKIADVDPDMEEKMMKEIPAVLHFLRERSIFHPRVSRLWFKPDWFITEQMRVIVETTKNRIDRVFEEWIVEQFLLYKLPVLRLPLGYLTEVFNDAKNSKYKIDAIELKAYLTERKGLEVQDTQRIKRPNGFDPDGNIVYLDYIARPLIFRVEQWLSPQQKEQWSRGILPVNKLGDDPKPATQPATNVQMSLPSTGDDLPF